METFISSCCDAFVVQNGFEFRCSKCDKVCGNVKDDDDIIINVDYNTNPTIVSTINTGNNFIKTAQRCSHDATCMLVDNKICPKCSSRARFLRDLSGRPVFVCSKCRLIVSNETD